MKIRIYGVIFLLFLLGALLLLGCTGIKEPEEVFKEGEYEKSFQIINQIIEHIDIQIHLKEIQVKKYQLFLETGE